MVMSDEFDIQPITQTLANSSEVVIVVTQNPTYDMMASALAMYLTLKSNQKNVEIACPSAMVVEFSRLVGLDKVKSSVGNKNLVVSFDYLQDSIEKVNYHVEGKKFNLVIQPKKGTKPLDANNVSYSYSGLQADVIFAIGAKSYNDLGDIYSKNQLAFDNAYTISINQTLETHFTQTAITDSNASSHSEITVWLLEKLGYMPENDAASNLLSGIDHATNRFSAPNTPGTAFMAAGKLIQNGAVRQSTITRPKAPNVPMPRDLHPDMQKTLLRPMSVEDSKNTTPDEQFDQTINPAAPTQTTPPKDWLEPKIFSGSSKL